MDGAEDVRRGGGGEEEGTGSGPDGVARDGGEAMGATRATATVTRGDADEGATVSAEGEGAGLPTGVPGPPRPVGELLEQDPRAAVELFAECELLRAEAAEAGVVLDDSPASLEALDQLLPRWRSDPELLDHLGNDAGFYLGTVVARTVPGAVWRLGGDGTPVVLLPSGRELAVVEDGLAWAESGAPELSQVYGEVSEG